MEESKIAMKVEEETKNLHKLAEKLEEVVKYEFDKGVENVDAKEMGEVIDMIKDIYEAKEKVVKACYYKQIMEAMEEADFEDEEEIMDYGRRFYRGQPRDSRGRYMSRRGGSRGYEEPMFHMTPEMYREHESEPEWYRDMDREKMNRMYYTESGNSGIGSRGSMGGSTSGMSSGGSTGSTGTRNYGGERGGDYGRQSESRYDRARRNYTETKEMHKDNSAESKQEKMKSLEEYMKELGSDLSELVTDMDASEKTLLKNKMQVLMTKIQ